MVGLLVVGLSMYVREAVVTGESWSAVGVSIVSGFFTARWITEVLRALWTVPLLFAIVAVAFAASFGLQFYVASELDRRYSAFWHDLRRPLRKTLGF